MAYVNQDMQDMFYVPIGDIPDLLKKADDDDLTNRDTRDMMYLFSRMATVNSRLAGFINTRKMGYASFKWNINSDDDKLIERIKPFIRAIINNYINAAMYGIMGFKIEWVQTPELGWIVGNTIDYPIIEIDYEGAELLLVDQDENTKSSIKPDNLDYFYFIYPKPDRGGIMRSVIVPELLRHDTVIEWKNLNKRMKGIVAATIDVAKLDNAEVSLNLSEAEKLAQLANVDAALAAVGTNNSLRTLDFADIQFKSLVEGTAGSSYQAFKDELDSDIAIAILGQANSSELPSSGGSRAALQVLNLIRTDILLNDMLNIKDLVDRALLVDFKKNKEPSAVTIPYEFEWVFDDNEDIESYASVFETIGRSTTPVIVSTDEYYLKLGLTRPEGVTEDTITLGGSSSGGLI